VAGIAAGALGAGIAAAFLGDGGRR
jgi:hypothetical protein